MPSLFDGIDLQIGGIKIDGRGGSITPEIIDQAFKLMMERSGRATCEGSDGVMRHLVDPKFTLRCCIVCGWDVTGCVRA